MVIASGIYICKGGRYLSPSCQGVGTHLCHYISVEIGRALNEPAVVLTYSPTHIGGDSYHIRAQTVPHTQLLMQLLHSCRLSPTIGSCLLMPAHACSCVTHSLLGMPAHASSCATTSRLVATSRLTRLPSSGGDSGAGLADSVSIANQLLWSHGTCVCVCVCVGECVCRCVRMLLHTS